MELQIKEHNGFQYVDEGSGDVLLLLHGLFGALSNWEDVVETFRPHYRVVIPLLPIYDMPLLKAGVPGLVNFVEDFVAAVQLPGPHTVLGNSLGGHIALVYTLHNAQQVSRCCR